MKFAIIVSGVVANIAEASEDFAQSQGWIPAGNAGIGWLWDGETFTAPPQADRVAVMAEKWTAIKAERERRSNEGGYSIQVDGSPRWFHSDPKSKTQQLSLVMLGASIVAVPPWKTMDGTRVKLTQAQAGQVFGAAVAMDGALFAAADAHDAAMRASADPATYDFSGGWPLAYGETA